MSSLSSESYPDTMSLDDFFAKAGFDGDPNGDREDLEYNFGKLKKIGYQTVGEIRKSTEWRSRVPQTFYVEIDSRLKINIVQSDNQLDSKLEASSFKPQRRPSEIQITDQIHSELFEKWKPLIVNKISSEMQNEDHPFNFRSKSQILARQKQVYTGIGKHIMPHTQNSVVECNMLFGSRYVRTVRENENPIFARVSDKMDTEAIIITASSLDEVLSKFISEENPLYVLGLTSNYDNALIARKTSKNPVSVSSYRETKIDYTNGNHWGP